MLRLFNFDAVRIGLYAFFTLFCWSLSAQVTSVDYQIKYNTDDCVWDFYIIIQEGSATTVPQRAQFNSQLSFVVPTGTAVNGVPINHMPLQNNQTYTGTVPLKWTLGTAVVNPAASPGNDFYPVTPTLSPASFYNDVFAGDTVKIFSLDIGPFAECGSGIRLFNNDTDPPSDAPGMGGGDFSNGFTMGGSTQLYNTNAPKEDPPPPVISATNECTSDLLIDLDASTSTCQSPLSYSWTGPGGFTSTDEDVSIMDATDANNGTYSVTVTDDFGCSSVLSIDGEVKPDAGSDVEGCPDGSVNLQGALPATGSWTADATNPSGATLVPGAAGAATVNFDSGALGTYNFIYSNILCSDTVAINIILPDAGTDPDALMCHSADVAFIDADPGQSGVWSVDPSSAGTANIDNPNSASTFVNGFSDPGDYILVWTVGACSDFITITTGDECGCAIANNILQTIDPNFYCGSSGNVLIDGNTATPSGTYVWEYSLDGGTFSAAPGTNNTEDYTTNDLSLGTHDFRRIFTTNTGIICSDTSNVVGFTVFDIPPAPSDIAASPPTVCVSGTTTIMVTNNPGATYTWSASDPDAGLGTSTTNSITMTPTASGTYTISVTQTVNGCESPAATIDVDVIDLPPTPTDISTSSTDPTACGADDGTITLSGYNANASYTLFYVFELNPISVMLTSNGSGELVLIDLAPGTYSNFQVVNDSGCFSDVFVGPITLSDPSAPDAPEGIMATPNPECLGEPITISVTDNPGATYTWTANSPNAGLGSSTTNTVTMNATVAGFYIVSVTQTVNGCVSPEASISVSVNDAPPTPDAGTVTGTNPSACGGMDGFISISGYAVSTQYDVMYTANGTPTTVTLTSNGSGIIIIPDLTEGTYTNFSVTNNIGCESGVYPGPVSLSEPGSPDPPANLMASPNPVCLGNTVTLSVSTTPGATYNWTASSPDAGLNASSGGTVTMDATVAGTYTISVSVTVAGCTSASSSIDVVVSDTPATPSGIATSDPTTCSGSEGSITISGYDANTDYTLDYSFNGSGQSVSVTSDGSGNIVITGLASGTYTDFVVTNTANCPSDTFAGPVTLSDPSDPAAPTGIAADPNPICQGESMTISVDNVPGATYTWSISPPDAGFGSSTTNSIDFTPVGSGVFVVSVFQTVNNCTSPTSDINAIVEPSPDTPSPGDISTMNPSFCTGSDGSISISNLDPNVTYGIQYDSAGVVINEIFTADGSGVLTITDLAAGSYSNIILTNSSGCSSPAFIGPVSLVDPGAPDAPENLTGIPNPSCLGTTVDLSVTNTAGASYNWSASDVNAGLVATSTNATTMLATVAGTYTIFVTQTIAGCTSPAAMIDIVVNEIPPTPDGASVVGTDLTDCNVDNGIITLSGLLPSTTYTLTYSTNGTPSTGPFTTNASGEIIISSLAAGVYSDFSLENAAGCASGVYPGPVTLTAPTAPAAPTAVGTDPADCGVANGSILVGGMPTSANVTITYSFNGSPVSNMYTTDAMGEVNLTGLAAGSYTDFGYVGDTGCDSEIFAGPVTLTEPAAPAAPTAVGTDPTDCGVANGSILVGGMDASANITLSYSFNGSIVSGPFTTNAMGEVNLTGLAAGDYTNFSYISASGCTSDVFAGPVTLSEPAAPAAPTAVGTDPTDCGVANGSILVGGMDANASITLTYSFNGSVVSGPFTTNAMGEVNLTGLAAGDYTNFSYISASGCTSDVFAGPVTLSEPAAPAAPTAVGTDPTDCGLSNGSILVGGLGANADVTLTYSFNGSPVTNMYTADASGEVNLTGLGAGIYTNFSYVNASGCTSDVFAGPVTLSEPNAPPAPTGIAADPNPICIGETVNLSVDFVSGATYTWSASSANAGLVATSTETTTMTPTAAGTYTISVFLTISGCASSPVTIDVQVIDEPPAPTLPDFTANNPSACGASDGSILISGYLPGASYTLDYSFNGSPITVSVTANGSGELELTMLSAGTYSDFFVTNGSGCVSGIFAGPVVLADPGSPDAPTGLTATPNPVCLGGTVNLSVDFTAGATYDWNISPASISLNSNGNNTNSFVGTTSGVFTITVSQTIAGCTSPAASIEVLVIEDCVNPDFGVTYNDIPLTGLLGTNDSNIGGSTYGNLESSPGNPSGCAPVVSSDGSYTFTCAVPGEYEYTVEVCKVGQSANCIKVPLVITVLDIDITENPPIANHDYIATTEDNSVNISSLDNDKCQSIPGCVLNNLALVIPPNFGSFNTATQVYSPNFGFVGRDSFRYEVCQDPLTPQSCDQEWVYIDVYPSASTDFTNAMDDYNQTALNSTLTVSAAEGVLSNDVDPLDLFQVADMPTTTVPGMGSITFNSDGSYTFVPFTDYVGPVDFEYQVCRQSDPTICADATLHLLVEPQSAAGALGSCVWEDIDANGRLDAGEPAIEGIDVVLFTSDGIVYDSTVTDADGLYEFFDVPAGDYFFEFIAPEDLEFTFPNVGDDLNDSDVDGTFGPGTTTLYTLTAGQLIDDVKAGLYECNLIGENVWYDINENDVYDDNENGINGLRVFLWRLDNGVWSVWDETTTGKKPDSPSDDGWYQFCAPPGTYYIEIILPPTGLVQVIPFVGNDPFRDSDINNGNGPGTTNAFTIVNGQDKLDIGAGYYPMAEAGNLVWHDENFDGIQNQGEARIANVVVEAFDAVTFESLAKDTTDQEGIYRIDYLEKKEVFFKFTPPGDMVATVSDVGLDEIDSDVDHTFGLNTTRKIQMTPGNFNEHIDFGVAFGALPVRWLDVKVKAVNDGHELKWEVEQEVNVAEYEVQRSLDGVSNFETVSNSRIAANNVLSKSSYTYVDAETLQGGTYYYRIKQIDFDGKFNYSPKVFIEREASLESNIYPNPATNLTYIGYKAEVDGQMQVSIIDARGKLVKVLNTNVEEGTGQLELDVSNLIEGVYTITIELENTISNKKLIKIK